MSSLKRLRLALPAALTAVLALTPAPAAAQQTGPPATLVFANRPIVELRATAFARTPAERADAAAHFIERLVKETPAAQVTVRRAGDAMTIHVGEPAVFGIMPDDVNTLAGET